MCQGGFSARDSRRRRDYLLAYRRNYTVQRTKREIAALRRAESHSQWESLSTRRFERHGYRKTGTASQRQITINCSLRALIHISVKEYSRACVVDALLGGCS